MEKTIDARGMMCPRPVILTKKELANMTEGQTVTIVDNHTAVINLSDFAGSFDYGVEVREDGSNYYVTISKKTASEEETGAKTGNDVVVLINSNRFGEGDAEFGEALMRNFIFALTETEPIPGTLIFVNQGIFFACKDSLALESLQKLQAGGCKILSCGACLDYYEQKERLAIGGVTNMYDIAQLLVNAGHVIKV
jgi:selenium metabolism protein YedF